MSKQRISIGEIQNLPVYMKPSEANEKILHVSENKLYELLNRQGCPKLKIGRKYLLPTAKFISWLEEISLGA